MSELHRLVRSRCALTVQAASKATQGDGSLSAVLQLDTQPESFIAEAMAKNGGKPVDASEIATRLVECELSPAQLFTLLAALEEAQAKLSSKQAEETGKMAGIRGSSVALNEVLDVTIDDICNVLSYRPVDVQLCRERLSGLMRSVIRMWAPPDPGSAAANAANMSSSASSGRNNTTAAPPKLQLQPPPPRLVDAMPNLIEFLMHVSNLPNVDNTAENMVWNLLFRLLLWTPTWPQRVANFVLSRMYFFLHSARRQMDKLTDAQERSGAPKWLYDVHAAGGAPLEAEVAVWVCALVLYKLPTASVRVMLAPPMEHSSPQSAPFVKLLRKIAVDVCLFTVARVRSDCMPAVSVELQTFPIPALDPQQQQQQNNSDDPDTKAFSRIPLESMWLLAKTMRTAALALHDGTGSLVPDYAFNEPAGHSNQSTASSSVVSSSAAAFLFALDQRDDDDELELEQQQQQQQHHGASTTIRSPTGNTTLPPPAANSVQYRNQQTKAHGRSLCCHASWLGALRVLSSVVHTATFELLAKRPDSGFAALTAEEVQELQAKPLFRAMGASPANERALPDEDFGSCLAMLVHCIVRPKPYRSIVLASVAQLSRCAVTLCAIDGLSRHVRGRLPHPAITRAAFELLAAGVHHPNHQLLEHSLTQALAEIYMMHKAVRHRYYVSVPDVGCVVSRVLDVATEFEAALRTAYPGLFAAGHPYFEGWQSVVRVATWLNDTCVDDRPRRGEPLWQLSLYFLRNGRADQEPQDPVAQRFGQLTPSADEYFSVNSHREFLSLRAAEAASSDVQGGGDAGELDSGMINETAYDFTTALRWCGVDEWEEQMDRIELRGSVAGSRATLNAYLSAQQQAVDRLASSAPSTTRRDAAFRNRLHRLMTEQRTVRTLVRDGHTSFATTVGGYKPSPSMAASLCFFNDILEWATANNALDIAIEYTEAYVGVVDNLSGHAGVAASISSGLLQLDALADRKKSALLVGLQAEQWCNYRLCDLIEGSRLSGLVEGLF